LNNKLDITKSFRLKSALGSLSNMLEYFSEEDRIAVQSDY